MTIPGDVFEGGLKRCTIRDKTTENEKREGKTISQGKRGADAGEREEREGGGKGNKI